MVERIQVLIVDDQLRVRQSLRALLNTWPILRETWVAASGREAMELIGQQKPDVVLMDVCMPEMDGLQATRLIKARWPQIKVIVLSMYAETKGEALAAGADAFIDKGEPPERLLATLSAVAINQCSC